MTPETTLRKLDELIASRSILQHPFYVAWERGELSRTQLASYAETYYPHVAAFPRYLESAIAASDDLVVRSELQDNLADELSNPKAHNELWLDFAEDLGLDRNAVADAPPRPAAERTVKAFDRLTQQEAGAALAALYAYESQQPEVSRRKSDGLQTHYGVSSPNALAYFNLHAEADIRHRQGERAALFRCLANGASPDAILTAANQALDAYWQLLDGICQEAGIEC